MTPSRSTAEASELDGKAHADRHRWLPAAGAYMAAAIAWRKREDYRRAESCFRCAAAALDRIADEVALEIGGAG